MSEEQAPRGCYVATGCLVAVAIAVVLIGLTFAALFYFGFVQRGGVYDSLRVQLAQSQLSQLVPYIELYHTQNGVYPERIERVADVIPEGIPITVWDATEVSLGGDQDRAYHYQRVGAEHYILRGVGADGVVFTDDDILPSGYEQTRTGLLLERPPAAPPEDSSEQTP